jgi:hypothetical protein
MSRSMQGGQLVDSLFRPTAASFYSSIEEQSRRAAMEPSQN